MPCGTRCHLPVADGSAVSRVVSLLYLCRWERDLSGARRRGRELEILPPSVAAVVNAGVKVENV